MSHVFHRVLNRKLPRAVRAKGVWIEDADGRRYLDGAGGVFWIDTFSSVARMPLLGSTAFSLFFGFAVGFEGLFGGRS